ncbi:Zn(2)-C6 fungal-type domain-containing protein [Mycena chlorophos]|uniref:Zn(2)-C6 fungal-type domain-containing protein n=1 Tax=Mycena chlorophos TaxID=658473 RepID=A0A8H6S1B9_MYCCL|nr:Zn(2)-C6 fungal-type domain-containing protein [Mycena chlorophos]
MRLRHDGGGSTTRSTYLLVLSYMAEHNLHRGAACTNCRRRKIRCDAGRPICGQCINKPPRSGQPCIYESESGSSHQTSLDMRRTIGRLRTRIEELENSNEQGVLLQQPYTGPAIGPIPEPPTNLRNTMINAFLHRFGNSPYFFLNAQHFAQAAHHPPGHPERPSNTLLSIVFLWACVLQHSSPSLSHHSHGSNHEDVSDTDTYLLATLEHLPAALNRASSPAGAPGSGSQQTQTRFLLETIQAEVLLSFYYLHEGLPVQGRYHASAAASLAIGAGFSRIGHHLPAQTAAGPGFLFGSSGTGSGPVADGAGRAAFWATVIINNAWAAAQGGPAPISSYGTEVDVPWPGGQQSGATIRRFLSGQDVDGHSPIALIAKASTLVERVAAVTSGARGGQLEAQTYGTLDQRLQGFQAALPPPGDANTRSVHLLTDLAIVRLQLPHAAIRGSGARQKALVAAERITGIVREVAGMGETTVDPLLGPVASAAHSVFSAELSTLRNGPPTLAPQYRAVEQRLEGLLHAMMQLSERSPMMRYCLGSVQGHGHH